MQNNLGFKLIAVVDINHLKLFKAQGLSILNEICHYTIGTFSPHSHEELDVPQHPAQEHQDYKETRYKESSKAVMDEISRVLLKDSSFKKLYIVADAKMLGHLRKCLNSNLKKILEKEVAKDLMRHRIEEIEKAIFE